MLYRLHTFIWTDIAEQFLIAEHLYLLSVLYSCSVDCFCNHKGSCAISEDVNTGANPSKEKSNQEFQFPTEDTVPKEKLEKLGKVFW